MVFIMVYLNQTILLQQNMLPFDNYANENYKTTSRLNFFSKNCSFDFDQTSSKYNFHEQRFKKQKV